MAGQLQPNLTAPSVLSPYTCVALSSLFLVGRGDNFIKFTLSLASLPCFQGFFLGWFEIIELLLLIVDFHASHNNFALLVETGN